MTLNKPPLPNAVIKWLCKSLSKIWGALGWHSMGSIEQAQTCLLQSPEVSPIPRHPMLCFSTFQEPLRPWACFLLTPTPSFLAPITHHTLKELWSSKVHVREGGQGSLFLGVSGCILEAGTIFGVATISFPSILWKSLGKLLRKRQVAFVQLKHILVYFSVSIHMFFFSVFTHKLLYSNFRANWLLIFRSINVIIVVAINCSKSANSV